MRSALIPNTAAETRARDTQEAQDEVTRRYWADRDRFGWTPFYVNCPLDAIEDVARGLRPEASVRFLPVRHVVEVGRDEWNLDGDLELWRKARIFAMQLWRWGFLSRKRGQGELVYQRKAARHTPCRAARPRSYQKGVCNMSSVPQDEQEVKCSYDGCEEPVFRDGLCWEHFIQEKLDEWDAQDAEREACLEGVGYVFGDPVDRAWFGHPVEEVCR